MEASTRVALVILNAVKNQSPYKYVLYQPGCVIVYQEASQLILRYAQNDTSKGFAFLPSLC